MKYNLIVFAVMSLHTSQNVRYLFEYKRMNFLILRHLNFMGIAPQTNLQAPQIESETL